MYPAVYIWRKIRRCPYSQWGRSHHRTRNHNKCSANYMNYKAKWINKLNLTGLFSQGLSLIISHNLKPDEILLNISACRYLSGVGGGRHLHMNWWSVTFCFFLLGFIGHMHQISSWPRCTSFYAWPWTR